MKIDKCILEKMFKTAQQERYRMLFQGRFEAWQAKKLALIRICYHSYDAAWGTTWIVNPWFSEKTVDCLLY